MSRGETFELGPEPLKVGPLGPALIEGSVPFLLGGARFGAGSRQALPEELEDRALWVRALGGRAGVLRVLPAGHWKG